MEVAENIRFVSSADNLVVRKMTGLRSEKDYPGGYTCKYISIIARNHAAFTSGLPARLCGQGNCEEGCGREARSQATVGWFEHCNTIGPSLSTRSHVCEPSLSTVLFQHRLSNGPITLCAVAMIDSFCFQDAIQGFVIGAICHCNLAMK